MDEDPLTTVGRITLAMLGTGFGIALVAFLTGQWISATVVPGLGAAEEQVVVSYTPLAFLSITALSAPIVAGLLGISESARSTATKHAAVVAVACLVGASLMVVVAGTGIAFAEPSSPDAVDDSDEEMSANDSSGNESDGDDSGEPGLFDIVGLAGLCGVGSLVSGGMTTKFGA
jgi:hypothetical protein